MATECLTQRAIARPGPRGHPHVEGMADAGVGERPVEGPAVDVGDALRPVHQQEKRVLARIGVGEVVQHHEHLV